MRTILVAPTAFKGTLSPLEVADAIEAGVREAWATPVDVISLPIADGGDGTIEAMYRAAGGKLKDEQVLGPTGEPVSCQWLKLDHVALCELASCCGLALLPHGKLQPLTAHTYGLGQIITRAFEAGCTEINVAVGGSASTDGGTGALKALGAAFLDDKGDEIQSLGGGMLSTIGNCDLSALRWLTRQAKIRLLTDVDNPLLGTKGAAAIFAPQKGADPQQVELLECGLTRLADIMEEATGQRLRDVPGAGAAGGTAFGLATALGAEIYSGFDWVAEAAGLDERIAAADLVITGEGCFDSQSLEGKAVGRLIKRCASLHKNVVVVSGKKSGTGEASGVSVLVPEAGGNGLCGKKEILDIVAKKMPQLFHD